MTAYQAHSRTSKKASELDFTTQAGIIYSHIAVRSEKGSTIGEASHQLGMKNSSVSARFAELEADNLIIKTEIERSIFPNKSSASVYVTPNNFDENMGRGVRKKYIDIEAIKSACKSYTSGSLLADDAIVEIKNILGVK